MRSLGGRNEVTDWACTRRSLLLDSDSLVAEVAAFKTDVQDALLAEDKTLYALIAEETVALAPEGGSACLLSRPLLGPLLSQDLGKDVFLVSSDGVDEDILQLGFQLGTQHPHSLTPAAQAMWEALKQDMDAYRKQKLDRRPSLHIDPSKINAHNDDIAAYMRKLVPRTSGFDDVHHQDDLQLNIDSILCSRGDPVACRHALGMLRQVRS